MLSDVFRLILLYPCLILEGVLMVLAAQRHGPCEADRSHAHIACCATRGATGTAPRPYAKYVQNGLQQKMRDQMLHQQRIEAHSVYSH